MLLGMLQMNLKGLREYSGGATPILRKLESLFRFFKTQAL